MKRSTIVLIGPILDNLTLFRKELIERLEDRGEKLVLLTSYVELPSWLLNSDVKVIKIPIDRRGKNFINDLKLTWTYWKTLNQVSPDVVLTYTTKCSIYGGVACAVKKIPYIVNNSGLYNKEDFGPIMWFVLKLMYKVGYRHTACMMYQNHFERDQLNAILKNKVHYRDIPGSGVSLDKFKYSSYPSTSEKIVFNYVARIVNIKGINEYLECARIIKERYPNTSFRIFGSYDDESYKDMVDKAVKSGFVEYLGSQKNMLPFIETCHAVIHPSYYEGMTNVLLEHSAVGRACIASDIPGCREGIEEGVTGFLFEKKNVGQLVNVVEKFILLPHKKKEEMGRLAHEKMVREFDRDIVTNIYINEIDKICMSKK